VLIGFVFLPDPASRPRVRTYYKESLRDAILHDRKIVLGKGVESVGTEAGELSHKLGGGK